MYRRTFLLALLQFAAGMASMPLVMGRELVERARVLVNDIHSQLNPTWVSGIANPEDTGQLQQIVREARRDGRGISIAGGRHAMGGQQFGTDTLLIDTRSMQSVLAFDAERGLIEVEAGIQWPELIAYLNQAAHATDTHWSIIQKQTGADRLCIGGALGANVHGRGLTLKPIINDVESFRLVDASGALVNCSRTENAELFRLVIGGYGLFGVIAAVTLRLMARTKLDRVVSLQDSAGLAAAFAGRIAEGYLYGDFQFSIDPASESFLRRGVFSAYRPVDAATPLPETRKELGADDWRSFYVLAHNDPARLFDIYTAYYLSTSGQIYQSDSHQLSTYLDDYHAGVDKALQPDFPGTEMITEVYVPRDRLEDLLALLADDFRRHDVQLIYGTIRLIEKDDESFLAWAREAWACVVMNLHVAHNPQAIIKAERDFQRIIDRAIELGGSYYLTYHRWARRDQVDRCYPQLARFLELKRKYDPDEVFQSDWYRYYRALLV